MSIKQSKQLRIQVRLTYPQKVFTVRIANDAVFLGRLLSSVALELNMDVVVLSSYLAFAVKYKGDSVPLKGLNMQATTCKDVGIGDRTVLVFQPPSTMEIDWKQRRAQQQVEASGFEYDANQGPNERFAWLSHRTALKALQSATGARYQIACEYVDLYANLILSESSLKGISKKTMLDIVRRVTINATEQTLLAAVVKWAKEQLKTQDAVEATPEAVGAVVQEFVPLLRLGVLPMEDLLMVLAPLKVIPDLHLLALVQAATQESTIVDSNLPYSSVPRDGKEHPEWWQWNNLSGNLVLNAPNEFSTIKNATVTMLADEPVTSGRVTFSVRDIKHLQTSQYSLIVGVFDNADVDDFNNGSLSMDTHAWSYDHKKMIVKTPTGEQKVSAGGVLSITLDLNRGLIIFSTGQNDAVQFSTTLPIGQGKEYRAFIRARYLHASLAFNKLQL